MKNKHLAFLYHPCKKDNEFERTCDYYFPFCVHASYKDGVYISFDLSSCFTWAIGMENVPCQSCSFSLLTQQIQLQWKDMVHHLKIQQSCRRYQKVDRFKNLTTTCFRVTPSTIFFWDLLLQPFDSSEPPCTVIRQQADLTRQHYN